MNEYSPFNPILLTFFLGFVMKDYLVPF